MATAGTVIVIAAVLLTGPVRAQTAPCGPFSGTGSSGGGGSTRSLGDRSVASVVYARIDGQVFGFAVVARGAEDSGGGSSRSGGSSGGRHGQSHGTISLAPGMPRAEYDIGRDSSIVTIGNVRTDLRDGNVLLVDQRSGGTPTVTIAGCLDPGSRGAIDRLATIPAVRAFTGSGDIANRLIWGGARMILSGLPILLLAIAAAVVVTGRKARATDVEESLSTPLKAAFGLALALVVVPATMLIPLVREHGSLPVLLFPVALAVFPMAVRQPRPRALTCALMGILMTGFCIIGAMSIGLFFVPAALMLLIAALVGLISTRPARN
jgi:hypothetical protein